MKKTIAYIILLITFLITYFLQVNIFTNLKMFGVAPNLFILLILSIGLFLGKYNGLVLGIIFGFMLDIYAGKIIGETAILFGLLGYVAGRIDKNFSKESRIIFLTIFAAMTCIYEISKYLIECIIYKNQFLIVSFSQILLLEILYNSIIIIIIHSLIINFGYAVQKLIKRDRIMSRYWGG